MSSQTALELVVGVAVLALLIYRQLSSRPVRTNPRLLVILVVIGLFETVGYFNKVHAGTAAVIALVGSLVLAAAFGAVRAVTVKIWLQDGQPWSKGNLLTAGLWILALAAHLGYDYLIGHHKGLSGLGDATILLYLVVSLAVQRLIVVARAQRLAPEMATAGTGPAR
ncbi:MAG TPA: hypothetical protein VGI58_06500 [Streptosporangiaceae bacterium]